MSLTRHSEPKVLSRIFTLLRSRHPLTIALYLFHLFRLAAQLNPNGLFRQEIGLRCFAPREIRPEKQPLEHLESN